MAETTEKPEGGIRRQQYLVEKLETSYKEKPSDDVKLKLERETDTLKHLVNSEKGGAKTRAREKAEFARKALLNRAIQQVPAE